MRTGFLRHSVAGMTHAHRTWLLAGALCLAGAAPSAAAEPVNGRLAFTTFESSADPAAGDIWTMNPDGSDRQAAVLDPRYDAQSDWSPDGTKIVFRSRRNNRYEVSVVDFTVRPPRITDVAARRGRHAVQPAGLVPERPGLPLPPHERTRGDPLGRLGDEPRRHQPPPGRRSLPKTSSIPPTTRT